MGFSLEALKKRIRELGGYHVESAIRSGEEMTNRAARAWVSRTLGTEIAALVARASELERLQFLVRLHRHDEAAAEQALETMNQLRAAARLRQIPG